MRVMNGDSTAPGLRVIGAGASRTGTDSLRAALDVLGLPCYHGNTFFSRLETDGPVWQRALDGDLSGLDPLFAQFHAAVDAPAFCLYRELLDRYPDAQVILTLRPTDDWLASYEETVLELPRHPAERHVSPPAAQWADRVIWPAVSRAFDLDVPPAEASHEALADGFRRHTDAVIAEVPPDQLLVFRSMDGWGPLCDFLGVPVPDVPYPHRNQREVFQEGIDRLP